MKLDSLHTLLGFVLAVENRKFGEDTHLHEVECHILSKNWA